MLRWRTALHWFYAGSGIAGPDYGSGLRSDDTGEVLPLFLFPNLANRLFDRAKHIEFRVIHPIQKTLNLCGLSSRAEHKVGASRVLRLIFLDANQRHLIRMCRIRNKIAIFVAFVRELLDAEAESRRSAFQPVVRGTEEQPRLNFACLVF